MLDLKDGESVEIKGSARLPFILASSAESMGEFWLR
jgi:hypothetical protein